MVGAGESEEGVELQRQQTIQQWERQKRADQAVGVKPRSNNVGSLKKLPGRPKDPPPPVQALVVETVPGEAAVSEPTPEEREASYRHTRILIVAAVVAVLFILWIKQRIRP